MKYISFINIKLAQHVTEYNFSTYNKLLEKKMTMQGCTLTWTYSHTSNDTDCLLYNTCTSIYIVFYVKVVTYLPLYREWSLKHSVGKFSKIGNKYLYLEFRPV